VAIHPQKKKAQTTEGLVAFPSTRGTAMSTSIAGNASCESDMPRGKQNVLQQQVSGVRTVRRSSRSMVPAMEEKT